MFSMLLRSWRNYSFHPLNSWMIGNAEITLSLLARTGIKGWNRMSSFWPRLSQRSWRLHSTKRLRMYVLSETENLFLPLFRTRCNRMSILLYNGSFKFPSSIFAAIMISLRSSQCLWRFLTMSTTSTPPRNIQEFVKGFNIPIFHYFFVI